MSVALRLPAAFIIALILTVFTVPWAILLAQKLNLLDHPKGWKSHARPTPYLGGAAVLGGFWLAGGPLTGWSDGLTWLLICCIALSILGTLDDRWNLPATLRLLATAAAAFAMWEVGLGWSVFSSGAANLSLTVIWVIVLVNAVNLLDLMDGTSASTVAACAGSCAAVAGVFSDSLTAILALALCGSCLGFLRHNLRSPPAIFLGDGGTMPLGLLTAVLIETLSWGKTDWLAGISGAVLLCGVPIFDMIFRIFSRLRRGDTLLTAGPDSIANWLRVRLSSPRRVALALAVTQITLGSIAVLAADLGSGALLIAGFAALVLGGVLIVLLDASGFGRHLVIDRPPTGRRGQARQIVDVPTDSG